MLALPVGLAAYFNSRYKSKWSLWWMGGSIFILAQVGHIPFNYFISVLLNNTDMIFWPKNYQALFNALFLGFSAGIWEEGARYVAFRWWFKRARSWINSIHLGIGHGGFESIILGLLVLFTFIQMVALKDVDISTVVSPDNLSSAITAYWATPWYDSILGPIERILTFPIQIALSVLVMQVFIQNKRKWVWLAILFHTVIDASVVLFVTFWNIYVTEVVVAIFSVASIFIILAFKNPDTEKEAAITQNNQATREKVIEKDETPDNLDATRYQ
jgi:uncharacterized membrane protein YhfC